MANLSRCHTKIHNTARNLDWWISKCHETYMIIPQELAQNDDTECREQRRIFRKWRFVLRVGYHCPTTEVQHNMFIVRLHPGTLLNNIHRDDSRFAPSQWETALVCNDLSLPEVKPRISPDESSEINHRYLIAYVVFYGMQLFIYAITSTAFQLNRRWTYGIRIWMDLFIHA